MEGIISKLLGGTIEQEEEPTPDKPVPIKHKPDMLLIKVNGKEISIPTDDRRIKKIYKKRNQWWIEWEE